MPIRILAVFFVIAFFISLIAHPVRAQSLSTRGNLIRQDKLPQSDQGTFIVRKKTGMTYQSLNEKVKERTKPTRFLLNLLENAVLTLERQPQPELVLQRLDKLKKDAGIVSHNTIAGSSFEILTVNNPDNLKQAMTDYQNDPTVISVQPNYLYRAVTTIPDDPLYRSNQWNLRIIKMEDAWDMGLGNSSVKMAILDTGINTQHEDFKDQNGNLLSSVVPGGCFADHAAIPLDPPVQNDSCLGTTNNIPAYQCTTTNPTQDDSNCTYGHGSMMTGIAKAATNNGKGIASIAPNVTLIAIKVLDRYGSGTSATVAAGINVAKDQGAKIISLSLGGQADTCTAANPNGDCVVSDAIATAVNAGITVFVAAGNENSPITNYFPAKDPNVITVGATRSDGRRASYSNYGAGNDIVEIAAPGGDAGDFIASTGVGCPNNQGGNTACYPGGAGTSQATPHAAALAALLLSKKSNLTPLQIKQILMDTGDPINTESNKPIGKRINALNALNHPLVGGTGVTPSPTGQLTPTVTPTGTEPTVTPGGPTITPAPSPTPGPLITYLAGKVTNLAPNVSLTGLNIELSRVSRNGQNITVITTPVALQSDGDYFLSFTVTDRTLIGQEVTVELTIKNTGGRIIRGNQRFNNIVIGQELRGLNFSIYYCAKKFEGDANCDGQIDRKDLLLWKTEYRDSFVSPLLLGRSDFNGDGTVDLRDFLILMGKNL